MLLAQQPNWDSSDGDNALIQKYRQAEDTTGYPAVDDAIRFVWGHAGILLIFAALSGGVFMLRDSDSSDSDLRREAEERMADAGDSMHNPFNSPEGMQPSSQYVPVRHK
jgi:hypothetical protein